MNQNPQSNQESLNQANLNQPTSKKESINQLSESNLITKPTANIIKELLSSCKKAFYFCLVFSFFISVFTLVSSIYSMQVLDRVLTSNSYETLLYLTIIALVFLIFLGILTQVRSSVFLFVGSYLDEKLSPILFNSTIEKNAANKNIGSQNLKDLQSVKSFIAGPNMGVLFDTPFSLVYLIIIFFIHWINGIITVIGGLFLLKTAFFNEKITKELIDKTNKMQFDVMKDFHIVSSNSEAINAMGMKKNVRETWQQTNSELRKTSDQLASISNKISSTSKIIRMSISTLTMAASAILVMKGEISSGAIIATSILASKALAPVDNAIGLWKSIKTAKSSYHKINESLKNFVEDKNKIDLPEPRGELIVDKLIYKVANSDKILIKGVSFQINPSEVVAIIGKTGSGKTTLARLLVGVLKPNSGTTRIDSANLYDQDMEKIGKYLGYLPQDVELFKGSVKENIARMAKENIDEKVIEAANFCDIHSEILSLPNGYETLIEKDGSNLSSGQKQRIALARAYFGNVKLVVLDEPNSNLDTEGEIALNNTILKAKERKITTIIISHRPSVVSICDKVLLMQDGEAKFIDKNQLLKARESNNKEGDKKIAGGRDV